jgi:hypothetical protein
MQDDGRDIPAGASVILLAVPEGLVDDLPLEDQRAIRAVVGRPVVLVEYDECGRAELEFADESGNIHFIWVAPAFIRRADSDRSMGGAAPHAERQG